MPPASRIAARDCSSSSREHSLTSPDQGLLGNSIRLNSLSTWKTDTSRGTGYTRFVPGGNTSTLSPVLPSLCHLKWSQDWARGPLWLLVAYARPSSSSSLRSYIAMSKYFLLLCTSLCQMIPLKSCWMRRKMNSVIHLHWKWKRKVFSVLQEIPLMYSTSAHTGQHLLNSKLGGKTISSANLV